MVKSLKIVENTKKMCTQILLSILLYNLHNSSSLLRLLGGAKGQAIKNTKSHITDKVVHIWKCRVHKEQRTKKVGECKKKRKKMQYALMWNELTFQHIYQRSIAYVRSVKQFFFLLPTDSAHSWTYWFLWFCYWVGAKKLANSLDRSRHHQRWLKCDL